MREFQYGSAVLNALRRARIDLRVSTVLLYLGCGVVHADNHLPAGGSSLRSVPSSVSEAQSTDGTLAQVLQSIAAHGPAVLAAQDRVNGAYAQEQRARAAWFGKLDAYGLSQHFNDPRLTRPITQPPNVVVYPFASNQFGYGLDFKLPVDISGQIAARVDAAHERMNGAKWNAEDVRLRTILEGATLYRTLQALNGRWRALRAQRRALIKGMAAAQAGLHVGTIARVSLLRLQATAADVDASLATVDGQMRAVRAQLAALMGITDFTIPVSEVSHGPTRFPADPRSPTPSLWAATKTVSAARSGVSAARRAEYPRFAVNGMWNRNAIQFDTRAATTWAINLELRFNLWSGGAERAAISAARAREDEARHRLQGVRANLEAARETAIAQWSAQKQAYEAAKYGLEAAAEGARIEQDRFRNGLGSATDLIDAEAALARARASVTSALSSWWQADDALRYVYGEPPLALRNTMHSTLTPNLTQP